MDSQNPTTVTPDMEQLAIIQKKLMLDNRIRNGIGWFYWIAGLSLINTGIYLFGGTITFVIGLGVTQIVDGLMSGLVKQLGDGWSLLRLVGVAIDVVIAGVFILFGFFGRKRIRWPIILGLVLYILDGLMVLLFKVYLSAAFHALAIYGIWNGLNAIKQLEMIEKTSPGGSVEQIRQQLETSQKPIITPKQRRFRWIMLGLIFIATIMCIILVVVQQ